MGHLLRVLNIATTGLPFYGKAVSFCVTLFN